MASADRLIEVFNAANALPAGAERVQLLEEACRETPELKEQVLSLLQAHADAGDYLDVAAPAVFLPADSGQPGDRIGRYKLLERIGEGGCGVVYMAEQEEPVRRRVALKVIKLGMDTRQVIARFEAERQALALMEHPNIAKVLDAGATETGRPYFVMELVRGIKITDYCDQNNLSTNERLGLFLQVCHAIQHAHQKGIIHRDIKPSNILVARHDEVAVPKVIDFGIAKATTGQLTDKTVFTAFAQFIGTPAYMSPEQAQMSGLDTDTRADIYSLGVLLYELLTGRTPFDAKELLAAGMDEMRRKIREDEPAKPSTRLSTMTALDLTTVASRRHVEPPKLIHLIRGDLDWLVMKCLEKDRTRRYETANGLAMDLQRHLDDEPVTARPPSTAYRFQKLVRRNKLAFAAGSGIAVTLLFGMVGSAWQAARATRAEREQILLRVQAEASQKQTETEAAKATAISDFLQQMLRSANPDALKGSEYSVRQLLDEFSDGLANQLEDQPEVEAAVRATIGRAYFRLGVTDKAQTHLERALALRRRVFGAQSEPVAETLVDCAWTSLEQGQERRGEADVREALQIYRERGTGGQPVIYALWGLQKILSAQRRYAEVEAVTEEAQALAENSPQPESTELASMIHGLAEDKNRQSLFDEGEKLARRGVEMHRRRSGADHPETAWALHGLGHALLGQQRLSEAEGAFRGALQIFRKQYSPAHKSVEYSINGLQRVLEAKGDSEALETLARARYADANQRIERTDADSEAWMERAMGHADLNLWKAAMADCEEAVVRLNDKDRAKKTAGALACLQLAERAGITDQLETFERATHLAMTLFQQVVQENPQDVQSRAHLGSCHWRLGRALQNAGRLAQAEQLFLGASEFFEQASRDFPAEDSFRREEAASRRSLGEVVHGLGRVDEAVPCYRAAVDLYGALAAGAPQNSLYAQERAHTIGALADLLESAGQTDAAAFEYRRSIAHYVTAIETFPGEETLRSDLVELLRRHGQLLQAEPVLRRALVSQRKLVGNEHPDVAISLHRLGDLLRDSGKLIEAEAAFREAVAMRRNLFGDENLDLGHSLHGLAWVLNQNGKQDEAEALSREELEMRRRILGDEHLDVADTLHDLANFLRTQGKLAEAETALREAFKIRLERLGVDHPDVGYSLGQLSEALRTQGKLAEFESVLRDVLGRIRGPGPNAPSQVGPGLGFILHHLADVLRERKTLPEARVLAAEACELYESHPDWPAAERLHAARVYRAILADLGEFAELEPLERESVAELRTRLPADDPQLGSALALLTRTLLARQKFTDAEPPARECLLIREGKIPDDWLTFSARSLLGASLLGQQKFSEAEPFLLSAYEGMKQREDRIPVSGKPRIMETLRCLVQLYEATGRPEGTAAWKQTLAEFEQAAGQ